MKILIAISTVLFLINIAVFSQTSAQQPSGWTDGNGGSIRTLAELRWLSETPAAWDEDWRLTRDIDATETKTWNFGSGFNPIGNYPEPFTGSFMGGGHVISNLFINRDSDICIGLFGKINGAEIDSLGIVNCNISGSNFTGGLVGFTSSATVSNCYVTGSVMKGSHIGGLVGYNSRSTVSNCYANVRVLGETNIGGLIGYNESNSTVSNCYATGRVSGETNVGGLVGRNFSNSTITNGYFNLETSGQNKGIGYDENSQKTTGLTTIQMKQPGNFTGFDFSNVWNITSGETFPCLKAVHNAPIILHDLIPFVKSGSQYKDTVHVVKMDSEIVSLTLDNNPDGMLLSNFLISWTPDSSSVYSFKLKAVDKYGVVSDYTHTVPVHSYFGKGTENDPFWITTIEELNFIRELPDNHYILKNDLDFTGSIYDRENSTKGWDPIGMPSVPFTGSFKGGGKAISNLYINRFVTGYYVGLFGRINGAAIDSLRIINCNISGRSYIGGLVGLAINSTVSNCSASGSVMKGTFVGGLIGYSYSNSVVTDCYSTVNISGGTYTGGLIGENKNNSAISNCYATGNVSGGEKTGGLVGHNSIHSTISNCYATGRVSGRKNVGGLVGENSDNSTISNCYATSNVSDGYKTGGLVGYNYSNSTVSDCYATGNVSGNSDTGGLVGENDLSIITNGYYNSETSGQIKGVGIDNNTQDATGLTTIEMKQQESFAGFNFSSVWVIRSDSTYPALLGVDNAPFAFAETILIGISFRLEQLLVNDYDFETLQKSLVIGIDSISAGRVEKGIYAFPDTIKENDTVFVYYKIGEVRSGDTLWGSSAVSLIVAKPNTAPVFTNTTLLTNEDELLKINLNSLVVDNEGDVISFRIINTTKNGSLNLGKDTIVYSPGENFNGSDSFRAIVSDGMLSDTGLVNITVNAVNDMPVINSSAPLTARANETYTYTISASDVDGDNLTYSLNGAPSGMTISGNEISWIPSLGVTSSGEIFLIVSDGELDATETFTIEVVNGTFTENPESENLSLYPSPVNSVLTIQCGSIIEKVKVIALNGSIVLEETVGGTKKQLDLNYLQQGLYILQVEIQNETIVRTICKE